MRILGPDGRPIESEPPVAPEVRQFVERARQIGAQGDPHNALQQMVFAFQTDRDVYDRQRDTLRAHDALEAGGLSWLGKTQIKTDQEFFTMFQGRFSGSEK